MRFPFGYLGGCQVMVTRLSTSTMAAISRGGLPGSTLVVGAFTHSSL